MKKCFVAYSSADSLEVERLMVHLRSLEYAGLIKVWHDRQLVAGEEWESRIHAELDAADVIIFCVSADLLATEYVQRVEMPKAIARHKKREATLIPVIFGKCDWQGHTLKGFQAIPAKGETVQDYIRRGKSDDVWKEVTSAVRNAVQSSSARREVPPESLASLLASDDNLKDILIERLSGTRPEPFPSSGHWELFCHIALSVLTLRSIVDQGHGRGMYEKSLDASKFRPVLRDTDCPDPDTKGEDTEAKAEELVRQWLIEGHDRKPVPDIDGLIPVHPGLVFRISGDWKGWNNVLGCEPDDDTYGENLHTDMIEDRAFRYYIGAAKKVLRHIEQGQQARGWPELAMFTFLKRHVGEWTLDPRRNKAQSPTGLDAEDSVHEVLQDIASLDDEMKADGLEPSTEAMKNEARRIVIALAELQAEPTAYGTQDGDIAIQFGSGKSAVVIELSRVGGAACFSHVKGKNRWARYDDSDDLPDEFVLSQLHELRCGP